MNGPDRHCICANSIQERSCSDCVTVLLVSTAKGKKTNDFRLIKAKPIELINYVV